MNYSVRFVVMNIVYTKTAEGMSGSALPLGLLVVECTFIFIESVISAELLSEYASLFMGACFQR